MIYDIKLIFSTDPQRRDPIQFHSMFANAEYNTIQTTEYTQ